MDQITQSTRQYQYQIGNSKGKSGLPMRGKELIQILAQLFIIEEIFFTSVRSHAFTWKAKSVCKDATHNWKREKAAGFLGMQKQVEHSLSLLPPPSEWKCLPFPCVLRRMYYTCLLFSPLVPFDTALTSEMYYLFILFFFLLLNLMSL